MLGWIDRLGVTFLDAGLSATALFAMIAVGMLGLRQPGRRLWLAQAGVIGSLSLIPLIGFGLVPRVDILEWSNRLGVLSFPTIPSAPGIPLVEVGQDVGPWLARAFTVLYLAGVGTSLAMLLLGGGLLWWVKRTSMAPSAETSELYQSLPGVAVGRRPVLRMSRRMRRPALVGVVRPWILIPHELEQADAEGRDRLRIILLHELAHAETADPWFGLLVSIARAFWFVSPPFWWVGARMRIDREFLADRRAAVRFGTIPSYASSLISVASPHPESRGAGSRSSMGGEGGRSSPLYLRVLMLIKCPFSIEDRPPPAWALSLPCLAAVLTLSASAVSIRPPRDPVSGGPSAGSRSFRMGRLTLPALPADIQGRASAIELPIALPKRFDLRLEVLAIPADIRRMRIAGIHLAGVSASEASRAPDWHLVQIRREGHETSVQVDGEALGGILSSDPFRDTPLSVEPPPNTPALFRNLDLKW